MTEKIFFSYSRSDSKFVLQLAQNLRSEGVDLWLDQLDIKPGNRWDASIENALDSAKSMIIVLSPSSVDSNNVMDEVSFALESNKQVIPVLLSDCKIPFRLKRLQHIDFTFNYEVGLNLLLEVLGKESMISREEITSVLSPTIPVSSNPSIDFLTNKSPVSKVTMPEMRHDTATTNFDRPLNKSSKTKEVLSNGGKKNSIHKYILISGGVLLVILLFWAIKRPESGKSSIIANVDSASMAKPSNGDAIVSDSSLNGLILGRWTYNLNNNIIAINEFLADGTCYLLSTSDSTQVKNIRSDNTFDCNWNIFDNNILSVSIHEKGKRTDNIIFYRIVRISKSIMILGDRYDEKKEEIILKRVR